ncbi:MAG: polyphosphate kinase 1 [Burkholderiales bacterium]|nr:polyphosphate kinase 1 [Burkholderiales bacterium]
MTDAEQGAEVAPAIAPDQPALRLLSREASILEFNRRVLTQARRDDVPLLERLRYLTIVSSNIDEFFEIRVADTLAAQREPGSGVLPADVEAMSRAAHALIDEQYALLNDVLMPALAKAGIVVLNHAERGGAQRAWVADFFERQVRPLLVPLSLDPSHPFPMVANKSLNFIARLDGRDAFGRENQIAIVKVPRVLPRVIRLPPQLCGERQGFVLLTSVIRAHLGELFPGREVLSFSQFRVTRDSDLEVDGDDVTNLRQALRTHLSRRHFGEALRLEVVSSCPAELSGFLLEQFALPPAALYKVNGPVNLVRLNQLIDMAEADGLRFPRFEPAWPAALSPDRSILEQLREGGGRDVLLHHPFESFEPVVSFLQEAVLDPDVLAIRQTIYRTGSESVLMDLLIEAARRGKEVLVVVELKARFDEEANINWAERLEAVGAQVVYGIVGLKTHAKLLLLTRRERHGSGERLRRYAHLSTGNYNPRTARLYTDIGYFSTDAGLTADIEAVFLQLASQVRLRSPQHLVAAPFQLHRRMTSHLKRVAEAARAGRPARVVAKVNALTDPALIAALAEAGRAGASIDLIVRGACMLAPGVPGMTPNIRVRSVVGRFLEHSRIFYFRWGADAADEVLYLSSADWMSRNMFRRIEVAWPVRDAALRQRLIDEALVPYLRDERDAWVLHADGSYHRVAEAGLSAQQALMQRYG